MIPILYTTTTPILLAVKAQIVLQKVVKAGACYEVGNYEEPKFQADQVIQLWPRNFVIGEVQDEGGGRYVMHVDEILEVILNTRLMTDEAGRATNSFTDPKLGHFVLRSNTISALHDFWPVDTATGSALTIYPIKLKPSGGAEKKKPPQFKGWTTSVFRFLMPYRQLLSPQTEPPF